MTMNYLGVSGIPGLQQQYIDDNEITDYKDARIVQGLDSAAALISNQRIIFSSAEERFSGEKGTGKFPFKAINKALEYGAIKVGDITKLGWSFDYRKVPTSFLGRYAPFYDQRNIINVFNQLISGSENIAVVPVNHHYAHGLSTAIMSGYERALTIVADGMGELVSLSIYQFDAAELNLIHAYPISKSIGILYSIITRFLGFCFNQDEYKVMGMAAYGTHDYVAKFRELISFNDGKIKLNVKFNYADDPFYHRTFADISEHFSLERPLKNGKLEDQHFALAASLQTVIESVMLDLCNYWMKKTDNKRLCGAGGVFLNCLLNQKIADQLKLDAFFVQPAAGDDGAALGAALALMPVAERSIGNKQFDPYLGQSWSRDEIEATLKKSGLNFKYMGYDDIRQSAATALNAGSVIAWFCGRTEHGPRALGNRSILAHPGWPGIKDTINEKIKFRELFRPFAPAVLEEHASEYFIFEKTDLCYYMLQTAVVIEEQRKKLSGVVHKDGTARIQLVNDNLNSQFYQLIKAFQQQSQLPCLLNTSFNTSGQPLINDPTTAVETFKRTQLDALFIEEFMVWK
jgi:carbamoyltransferase